MFSYNLSLSPCILEAPSLLFVIHNATQTLCNLLFYYSEGNDKSYACVRKTFIFKCSQAMGSRLRGDRTRGCRGLTVVTSAVTALSFPLSQEGSELILFSFQKAGSTVSPLQLLSLECLRAIKYQHKLDSGVHSATRILFLIFSFSLNVPFMSI